MDSIFFFGAAFGMPVVAFFFMLALLSLLVKDRHELKIVTSMLFAAMMWILSMAIVLSAV